MKSVRINDNLFNLATQEASVMSRSTAGQIEHWVNLGMRAEITSSSEDIRRLLNIEFSDNLDELKQSYRDRFIKAFKSGKIKSEDGFSMMKDVSKNAVITYGEIDYE